MIAGLLAAVSSAGAVGWAWVALRRVANVTPPATSRRLAASPGRKGTDLEAVLRSLEAVGREPSLGHALRAGSHEARVGVLNEWLGDVAAELDQAGFVPKAAGRVALMAGTLGAVIELAAGLGRGASTPGLPLVAFSAGLVGAIACWEVDRRLRTRALRVREDWDAISTFLGRGFESGPAAEETAQDVRP